MKTVTIRDFRTRPKEVREALRREREAVLTVNGRPVALMIAVDAESLDEKLETLRRARGLDALREIRRESAARGLTRLSMREIDALVRATRKVKRRTGRG
jgi:antitoxin (DNA-binding transcriptional repressor) of toxin-antitoxin stability system